MLGPFGDPLFANSGWEKREYTMIFREAISAPPWAQRFINRKVVQLHFMFNRNSRQIAQIKFANSQAQGCVGSQQVALANDPPHYATEGEPMPFGFVPGIVINHLHIAFGSPFRWDVSHWALPVTSVGGGGLTCPINGCPIMQ